ncbi:hypothetical protein CDO73_06970 [Saccharibacillus sp. O23]|nr:hypothetical protein CDO73_06970 [Saccharibacillus sp. O23]
MSPLADLGAVFGLLSLAAPLIFLALLVSVEKGRLPGEALLLFCPIPFFNLVPILLAFAFSLAKIHETGSRAAAVVGLISSLSSLGGSIGCFLYTFR